MTKGLSLSFTFYQFSWGITLNNNHVYYIVVSVLTNFIALNVSFVQVTIIILRLEMKVIYLRMVKTGFLKTVFNKHTAFALTINGKN